ncbi:hypothetical protein GQF56_00995 [Rhodobacter sphaeroides]|uniref:Uncharacterized protein n=1 Tax=Cereibacter sphaeroides (strain ATCC 17023 / DSM 158 / JCM 6121 / CCUG 31486 / LMG 2827 / NBRC 12203 / NCIMB 8253 / ATH 2.4.1.) TaxID=272943 RepID=Q3IYE2_CERS4|nr:hypothetical protein RSP_1263 [Cereibacter sphaeroides 2.4.1]AXC62629.1 hypothetical protein DQL45_15060 [Cereibacter sphaeroides 2.4.1]MVX46451.1 hypothetical protein [Cereibacter sphaeroides]QHA11675.1 hypothetical protein GQR99_15035 [Cereibacter sphaeroides]QHA14597.1 hypothetical protein GQY06_15010 [Cereibacter sphaeroides]
MAPSRLCARSPATARPAPGTATRSLTRHRQRGTVAALRTLTSNRSPCPQGRGSPSDPTPATRHRRGSAHAHRQPLALPTGPRLALWPDTGNTAPSRLCARSPATARPAPGTAARPLARHRQHGTVGPAPRSRLRPCRRASARMKWIFRSDHVIGEAPAPRGKPLRPDRRVRLQPR